MKRIVLRSSALYLGNGIASALPLFLVASITRVAGTGRGAVFATCLTFSSYAAQLLFTYYYEMRLVGAPGASIRFPRVLFPILAIGVLLSLASLVNVTVGLVGLTILLMGLELSRQLSVGLDQALAEVSSAILIGATCVGLLFVKNAESVILLSGIAIALATSIRIGGGGVGSPAAMGEGSGWVLGETIVTGLTQPTLMTVAYLLAGPEVTVALRLVLGVGNIFAPALSVLRIRLLRVPSKLSVVFGGVLFGGTIVAIVGGQFFGIWRRLFGFGWNSVIWLTIVALCLWKLAVFVSTIPFTAFRRTGQAKKVFGIRLGSASFYFISIALGVHLGGVSGFVSSFAIAEVATSLTYMLFVLPRFGGPGLWGRPREVVSIASVNYLSPGVTSD